MTRTPARTLDARRYAETFAVFVARSHEYPAMLDRLVEAADGLPDGFACLDVGAGTGMVVRDWMARGGRRPGRYVAVEPSPMHAGPLRETVATLGIAQTDVLDRPFDARFPIPGRFDLVVFSHSLYWIPAPAACVRRAHDALNDGGTVLAFLQSPMGVHPLFKLFDPLLERDRPNACDHALSSHELTLALRDEGLAPRVDLDPTVHDLTGLFDAGNERERDDFLSFCLQAEVGELGEPLESDLVAYLRAACVEQNGRLHWPQPTAAVWVGAASQDGG